MTKCPTCNRPLNFAFRTKSKPEKKLAQDVARAQEAIESLRKFIHGGYLAHKETVKSDLLRLEAAELEITRLEYAISSPALLWRIYRRADKGESYVRVVTEANEVAA